MLDGAADGCMDAAWFLRGAADGCMVLQMAALRSAVIIIPYMVRLVTLFLVKWGSGGGQILLENLPVFAVRSEMPTDKTCFISF